MMRGPDDQRHDTNAPLLAVPAIVIVILFFIYLIYLALHK